MMVQAVRERFEGYTKQEVERAILARKLKGRIGNPSEAQFKRQLSRRPARNSLFSNCKISVADIDCMKGNMTRRKPMQAEYDGVSIPLSITDRFSSVVLVADVMFVCGMPFLVTISRGLKFVTAHYMPR